MGFVKVGNIRKPCKVKVAGGKKPTVSVPRRGVLRQHFSCMTGNIDFNLDGSYSSFNPSVIVDNRIVGLAKDN